MKQFFIDMGLVLLLLCAMSVLFGDHHVSRVLFERSLDQFEESVETSQEVGQRYVTLYDESDNHVSLFLKKVSEGCVDVMEFFVLVFSDLISLIF